MWKLIDGKLYQTKDQTRIKFRTNISKKILDILQEQAKEHNTYPNYLIENGLIHLLQKNEIHYNKKERPKDRIQYKTTYDKQLLDSLRDFASKHQLFMNDVIEYSIDFIDYETVKNKNYRYRIIEEEE